MLRLAIALLLLVSVVPAGAAKAADPNETIAQSEQVLAELIAIPGRQIPTALLAEAQGVAIVPRVLKIGFVAGGRRGYGVVLIRDAEGGWSLPRFVRLTGGSVGWQAGIQGTDVVLVFRTRRSVENLLNGKFTIGVDAAAAAGPVGRNAAAATDASLQAEILSYSRSRGLFLGASIDGSAIELDEAANGAFYGSPDPEQPQVVPLAASKLQSFVMELAGGQAIAIAPVDPAVAAAPDTPGAAPAGGAVLPAASVTAVRIEALRRSLAAESSRLASILNAEWQGYMAMPPSVFDPTAVPDSAALALANSRFERIAGDAQYAGLAARQEFQATRELLRDYTTAVQSGPGVLSLPAPPSDAARR